MRPSPKALLLAGAAGLSLLASVLAGPRIASAVVAGAAFLRHAGPEGWALFTALVVLAALIGIVPGALVGVAAGAVFGITRGFTFSAIGIMAGAGFAFALSRSTLRPYIGAALRQHGALARLDGIIARDGWRLVALLRVSPVMPFSLTSYALGFSGITLRDYLLGTLASLPALLGYVVIGALGGWGARLAPGPQREIHYALLALGLAATLGLIWHLSRLLRRALHPGPANAFQT
jgi:uncharacterized membrane protein YdjX (TVP38/TMEM64 family)